MEALFLELLNRSLSAGWLLLAVLVLRLVLRPAPKWTRCLLWALVAVRLLCPLSVESALSLIPSAEPLPPDLLYTQHPRLDTGIESLNNAAAPLMEQAFAPEVGDSVNPLRIVALLGAWLWLAGAVGMLLYALISYLRLRRRVAASLPMRDNILICDEIESPFILGVFRPCVYLPSSLTEPQLSHVVAHERAHLVRHDHWWKPLGFLLLSVYWFNPVLWLAYVLLCRDIELACDEHVYRDMELSERADYSQALLDCSRSRRVISVCPLAFGETDVKGRVRAALRYRKPTLWIMAVAVLACAVAAVCFLTDPAAREDTDMRYSVVPPSNALIVEFDTAVLGQSELDDLGEKYGFQAVRNFGRGDLFSAYYTETLTVESMNQAIHDLELEAGILRVVPGEIPPDREGVDALSDNPDSTKENSPRKEPPMLEAATRQNSVQAMRGTYSWHYANGDGTETGIEADSAHPLMLQGKLPVLSCYPDEISSRKSNEVTLLFEEEPDEVQVECWSEEHWGDYSTNSETIPVVKKEHFSFELKEGYYIYQVTAAWNRLSLSGGTAYYAFCGSFPILTLPGSMPYGFFSFAEVLAAFPVGTDGVQFDGFVNTEAAPVDGFYEAAERAKNEVTVDYNLLQIRYDEGEDVWAVNFFHSEQGGDETVYLGGDGVTRLIIYGE